MLVEPLGEDFWIVSGQTLTFEVTDAVPEVASYEDHVSVWIKEGDWHGFAVATATGDAVQCGYQRPPGAFDTKSSS